MANNFKIVMLGDTGVGKTSLVSQWIDGTYASDQTPTIGAAYSQKTVNVKETSLIVQIWDTAGEEKYQAMAPIYSQNAIGALIVFDLTRKETMDHVEKWVGCLQLNGDIPIVLAGNKSDLENRQISLEDGIMYATKHNYKFIETSASNGSGVDEAFTELVNLAYDYLQEKPTHQAEKDTSVDLQSQKPSESSSRCC